MGGVKWSVCGLSFMCLQLFHKSNVFQNKDYLESRADLIGHKRDVALPALGCCVPWESGQNSRRLNRL